jgi:hypothetical protein
VADAEVVAFVDAEPSALDAALAWARPEKLARTTPPTAAATSERRTKDLMRITSFGHVAHSTIATFRSAWSRLRVRSEAPREGRRMCRSCDLPGQAGWET